MKLTQEAIWRNMINLWVNKSGPGSYYQRHHKYGSLQRKKLLSISHIALGRQVLLHWVTRGPKLEWWLWHSHHTQGFLPRSWGGRSVASLHYLRRWTRCPLKMCCAFIALLVSHVGNAVSAFIVAFDVTRIHTPISSSFIQSSLLLLPQPNLILPTRSKSWFPNAPCHVHNIYTSFSMFFPVPLTPFLFLRMLYQSSIHKSLCLCSKYIIYPSCIVNSL